MWNYLHNFGIVHFRSTILINYFDFGQVVQEMSFQYISYPELGRPFCLEEQIKCHNFGINVQKMMCNNPKLDLVNMNAF